MVTPFRYCAENGSTKTLKPPPGRTISSSAARSSITRLYLKPLQPPGCTLTRSPPTSAVTPSSSMNFLTSTPAFGVTVRSISGCDETDIYPPVLHESYAVTPTPGSVAGSSRNDLAIQLKATTATASINSPGTRLPSISLPIPNSEEYTATIPAIQFVQASAPPGMLSRPKPIRVDTVAQPGPPGRTRR